MIAPSLDAATLGAVIARLREAGGCDRAVAIVEELRRGGVPATPTAHVLDTRMGCVEKAIEPRSVAT